MLNSIIRYFDLQSNHRSVIAQGNNARTRYAPVLPQYLVVSAGVFIEPILRNYMKTGNWEINWSSIIGRVVFGLIVGIIILPGLYKSTFDSRKPLVVQLAALFPLGIGWQTLFTSATKITLGQ
jgi:hypothetical protein